MHHCSPARRRYQRQSGRKKLTFGTMLAWLFLLMMIVVTLFPFWWVIRTIQPPEKEKPASLLPSLTWDNFRRVLGLEERGVTGNIDILLAARNSLIITMLSVFGSVIQRPGRLCLCAPALSAAQSSTFLYLMALMFPW